MPLLENKYLIFAGAPRVFLDESLNPFVDVFHPKSRNRFES